jgi:AcrR family transcriptional regulator
MARPRSEDKRLAILSAATQEMAELGLSAPTARIAKSAGVAEGTLFTYFSDKDVLLNHLYLQLKDEIRQAMMTGFPKSGPVKTRLRFIWARYLEWGIANPEKRNVMAKLNMSNRILDHNKALGMKAFADIGTMVQESKAKGLLRDQPTVFVAALFASIADLTLDFMSGSPSEAESHRKIGFDALWNAIAKV